MTALQKIIISLFFVFLIFMNTDLRAQEMEISEEMCNMMPDMAGCKEFMDNLARKRGEIPAPNYPMKSFPSEAPGIINAVEEGHYIGKTALDPKTGKIIRTYRLTLEEVKVGHNQYESLHFSDPSLRKNKNLIDAPTLYFNQDDIAQIIIENKLPQSRIDKGQTAIHWHGLILDNKQDGVPGLTQMPIHSGETYTYTIPLRHEQTGTYWYHPHLGLQDQRIRGAFIIFPKKEKLFERRESLYHKDKTILLTDFTEKSPQDILDQLRFDANFSEIQNERYRDFYTALQSEGGGHEFINNIRSMGMAGMDVADVKYQSFLANGAPLLNLPDIKEGERVRLRIINGAASSYFILNYANSNSLKKEDRLIMTVVAKDGQNVSPLRVDEILIGVGETYDVLVDVPKSNIKYELKVKSRDGSGFSQILLGRGQTLAPAHEAHTAVYGKGQAPEGFKRLQYSMLSALDSPFSPPPNSPSRPVDHFYLKLVGDMENYRWLIKSDRDTNLQTEGSMLPYIEIEKNHLIHLTIENDMMQGMMQHPMHLHGHFFRYYEEGAKDPQKRPLMHTATAFPGGKLELEFDSGETGEWLFHCHNLYHMATGMIIMFKYRDYKNPIIKSSHDHSDPSSANSLSQALMDHSQPLGIQGTLSGGPDFSGGDMNWGAQIKANTQGSNGANISTLSYNHFENDNARYTRMRAEYDYALAINLWMLGAINWNTFNIKRENAPENSVFGSVGVRWLPLNSQLLNLNVEGRTNGGAASVGTVFPIAPLTTLQLSAGVEGYEGKVYFEGMAGIRFRPHQYVSLWPVQCNFMEQETFCRAQVEISSPPVVPAHLFNFE